jgi:hypothetical protein
MSLYAQFISSISSPVTWEQELSYSQVVCEGRNEVLGELYEVFILITASLGTTDAR